MFCRNCGKEVDEEWVKCPYCGMALKEEEVPHAGETNGSKSNQDAGEKVQPGLNGNSNGKVQPDLKQNASGNAQQGVNGDSSEKVQPGLNGNSNGKVQPGLNGNSNEKVQPGLNGNSSEKVQPELNGNSSEKVQPGLNGNSNGKVQPDLNQNAGGNAHQGLNQNAIQGMNGVRQEQQVNSMPPVNRGRKIKHRSLLKMILLSLITFGIYGIYFMYVWTEDVNAICEGDGKKSPNFIVVFLLGTVTLGIYYLYWWYRQGCRIQEAAPRYGVHVRESGAVILIWQILGATLMMGIGSLLGTYIMVDNVNRIALGYNGEATAEELRNMRKPHPKAVRNALIVYGVLVVFAISMLVAGIAAFTSLGLTEDTTQSINTEAYADDSDSDSEPAPDKSEPAENPEASEDNSAEAAEPAPAEPAAKVVTLPVTVVNNTGVDIIELYASSTDSDDWEDDILGDDILDAGGVFHINFQFPADETKWDFAIVDENDNELEFYDLDFANCSTAGATLTLNYDGTTAHATLN